MPVEGEMLPLVQESASVGGRGGRRSWACRARRLSEAVGLALPLQTAGEPNRMRAPRPIWRQKFVDARERMTQQEATVTRKGGSGCHSRMSWEHHPLALVSQSLQ